MINIRTIKKLGENDGLTLKGGKPITYKSGWQVATEGVETSDAREAMNAVKAYNGDCGLWYSNGIYYIDKSHRVSTKKGSNARRSGMQSDFSFEMGKYESCLLLKKNKKNFFKAS